MFVQAVARASRCTVIEAEAEPTPTKPTVALAAPGALTVGTAAIYLGGLALAGVGLALLGRARDAGAHS